MDGRRPYSNQTFEIVTKMTPEMSKAIKRQEANAGLDYYRTGFSDSNDIPGSQDKKPTYRRLTKVNFDFPGLFLPTVSTLSLKPKRKPSKGQPIILGRSKTSLVPDMKQARILEISPISGNGNHSKGSAVADMTCRQLADTLLSYNKSPFTGLHCGAFHSSPLGPRYSDLFYDDKSSENTESEKDTKGDILKTTDAAEERRIPTFTYHTFQSDGIGNIADGKRIIVSPCASDVRESNYASATRRTKPQKSILKNGPNNLIRPSSETVVSHTYPAKPIVCSYQLPTAKSKSRSVSENRLPSSTQYPKIQNDLRDMRYFRGGLRNIPVKHEFTGSVRHVPVNIERERVITEAYKGISSRKRSVRFNAAHEVREYTPCDPISYC